MNFSFHNVLELLASFQASFFAIHLLTNARKKTTSNAFIAIFLLLLALNISYNFISPYIERFSVNASVFIMMTAYLMAPSLYLHLKSSIIPSFHLRWKDSIHLVPFILINIALIPNVYLNGTYDSILNEDQEDGINRILYLAFYILFLVYLIQGFNLLWKTKELYVENYSNTDIRKFNYLFQLNSIVTVVMIASALKNYITFMLEGKIVENSIYAVLLLVLLLFCWIIYKGLNAPELFNDELIKLLPVSEIVKEANDTASENSRIKLQSLKEDSEKNLKTLTEFMEKEKPYLDASLSLSQLSYKTKIPVRDLSILINHQLNQHFFDFINEYRINYAKKELIDPSKSDYTVLEILYDSGFNSKSSFNTAFKKITGYTPTQYRKDRI